MKAFDPMKYFAGLNPAEFDKYTSPVGIQLKAPQIRQLQAFIQQLPQDRNMLLYFWRFVFDMDIKTIRRFAGVDYANGRIETLRFACQRYLALDRPISNLGLRPVFEALIPKYELVLIGDHSGICWFRDMGIEPELIHEALSYQDKK